MVLDPAKKDVKCKTYQRSTADPSGFSFPEDADQQWEKDDPGKDQVDDKDEIPGKPIFKERRKDHRAVRGKKIEDHVTDQSKETDFVKAPEVSAFRYSYKEPTEEKSIKRNQQQGMGKIPMVFEIKLAFEETKNKIGVGEESHSQTCNRSPISNLFITDSFGNDRTCKRMSQAVHEFMVT